MNDENFVKITVTAPDLVPTYARVGDAGADLKSSVDVTIAPQQRVLVPTGVRLALPDGLVALVNPRSGLAFKHGITILNAPGTIDSGYRGEIGVILYNSSDEDFTVERGDRIAQLVITSVFAVNFQVVEALPDSERGAEGFGSTGVKN